jgi:hypothetical protein
LPSALAIATLGGFGALTGAEDDPVGDDDAGAGVDTAGVLVEVVGLVACDDWVAGDEPPEELLPHPAANTAVTALTAHTDSRRFLDISPPQLLSPAA